MLKAIKAIDGFDYGNSPYHYINADVEGKILVLTTTNGTKAINTKDHKVITASYINIDQSCSIFVRG